MLVTSDRDAFALIDDVTSVLRVRNGGLDESVLVTPATLEELYGVPPTLYRHLAALVGESSDNLPGVPKVGPKTAAKWLTQYGSLEGLVEHVDEVKGMAGENLRTHLADVLRNYQINALMTDLELPLRLPDLERRSWDREKVHQVFDTLQFRVLRDRLYATLESAEPEADSTIEVAGERVDAVLARVLGLSRGRSADLIAGGNRTDRMDIIHDDVTVGRYRRCGCRLRVVRSTTASPAGCACVGRAAEDGCVTDISGPPRSRRTGCRTAPGPR